MQTQQGDCLIVRRNIFHEALLIAVKIPQVLNFMSYVDIF